MGILKKLRGKQRNAVDVYGLSRLVGVRRTTCCCISVSLIFPLNLNENEYKSLVKSCFQCTTLHIYFYSKIQHFDHFISDNVLVNGNILLASTYGHVI